MELTSEDGRKELAQVRAEQEAWARSQGLAVDAKARVESWEKNLLLPLTPKARRAFDTGAGSELIGRDGELPKMSSLISSSALAINFFAPFETDADARALLGRVMGLAEPAASLTFEERCSTGLPGTPPHLDACLRAGRLVLGIESKFTEWLLTKTVKLKDFKAKYLERQRNLWGSVGLPHCQALAESIGNGNRAFQHLDALQLLKHALGLRRCFNEGASLAYVYLDRPGTVGQRHEQEIRTFSEAIAPEMGFRAWSYQQLASAVHAASPSETLVSQIQGFETRYIRH